MSNHLTAETLLSSLTASLLLAASTTAQAVDDWRRVITPQTPSARQFTSMAYHGSRAECVLFGGMAAGFSSIGGTFTYDGSTWTTRAPATNPPASGGFAIAYDPLRDRTVMFGGDASGLGGTNNLGTTWLWDGVSWSNAMPAQSPSPRFEAAMTFDATTGRIVLFGGRSNGTAQGDTWTWDGVTWRRESPAMSPGARYGHAMAHDVAIGRTVLFGGRLASNAINNETWLWDGATWTRVTPALSPSPRLRVGFAYDPIVQRCVLFGGFDGSQFFNDLWSFNSRRGNWQQIRPATVPPARDAHAMAWFAARGCFVAFGGDVAGAPGNDTWEYCASGRWISFWPGCAGSAGVPALAAVAPSTPAIGTTFTLRVTNVPAVPGAVVLGFGVSSSTWLGSSLPLDLGPFGANGCSAYTSVEVALPGTATAGAADFALAIPATTALLGVGFYNQAWVVDPAANALQLVLSNAGSGSIGR